MKAITLILLSSILATVTVLSSPLTAAAQTMNKTKAASSQTLTETETHMLFLILSKTPEAQIHRMRGADDNKVLTNKDGREVVFDGNGQLVKDNINDGTYNYANGVTDPFAHFDMDISPWIMMGISRSDPTDRQERIFAYMSDLQVGILEAWQAWPEESKKAFNPGDAKREVPETWVEVFKDPAARQLFTIMQSDLPTLRKEMPDNLRAIYQDLLKVYS